MRLALAFILCLGALGCSLVVDRRIDSNGGVDCATADDGTACGTLTLCLGGECVGSRCGDGHIDAANGEQCEDGNAEGGDGCEASSCRFTCEVDDDCIVTDPCAGGARCEEHRCVSTGLPADGTASCETASGGEGLCRRGSCAPPGCGDGVVSGAEQCDSDEPGCAGSCMWLCVTDAHCDDGNPCNGAESCELGAHICRAGEPMLCDDADPCSADSCDAALGCQHGLLDSDGDSYAPGVCAPGSAFAGGDCDDGDPQRNPSAKEVCQNGKDDDCDGAIDELEDPITWYPDADGDGFPAKTGFRQDCQDPNTTNPSLTVDFVQVSVDAEGAPRFDCADSLSLAYPGAEAWQTTFHCKSGATRIGTVCTQYEGETCLTRGCPTGYSKTFDWSCDGVEEPQQTALFNGDCCDGDGWRATAPSCGETATFRDCNYGSTCCLLIPLGTCTATDQPNVAQGCR